MNYKTLSSLKTIYKFIIMKKVFLLVAFFTFHLAQSQLIVNNSNFTPAQLVQNVLLGSGVTVSNITFNGSATASNTVQNKVARFSNGNTTNIGLTNGIILATGNAFVAIGPNDDTNDSQPSTISPGDPDLDLLTTNTISNKTIIEFDFIPNGNNLQFKFVFASEEYPEFVNSSFNDVFGFFISGPGISGPFSNNSKNIALIPGTTPSVPITINNLNNGTANNGPCINCAYYINNGTGTSPNLNSTIQYDGFTSVIAALSDVQCGLTYHIKLAIANVGDNAWDSAVFLEAGSFNITPSVSLPLDLLVSNGLAPCYSTSQTICSGLSNTVVHEWKLNGVVITGQTGPCVTVNQPGQLCATISPYGPACPFTDCMTVEFFTPMPLGNPVNLNSCIGGTFNLSSNTPIILNGLNENDYDINYYNSQADALNLMNPITNINSYPGVEGETIWVGIVDNVNGVGCLETRSFTLHYVSSITPFITCGASTDNNVNFNWLALSGATDHSVSYQVNSGPANTIGLIGNVNNYQVSGLSPGDNVQITITPIGGVGTCFGPATFSCTAASCPSITSPSSAQSLCFFGDPTPFSVSTNFTGSNAISYVYFTSPQTGNNMYTGGIPLGFSTPNTSGTATLDLPANGTLGSLPNTPGIYYVYAIANPAPADITCRPFAEIQVTVNAIPALPTVTTLVNYCQGETASQLTATGTGLFWYTTPVGGMGSATAPTPSTTSAAVGITTYYVSQTISGCEGPRSPISVTVNATPSLPTVTSPVTYCQNDTAPALTATGTGLLWYTAPTGGTGSETAPTPSTETAGITTYYVSQTISGCEGPRESISVTVNPTPAVAVNSPTINQGASATIVATPSTPGNFSYSWSVPAGATNPGNVPTFNTTVAGSYSVSITDINTGCQSNSATGILQYAINNNCSNDITIATPEVLCGSSSCTTLNASYVDIKDTTSYTVSSIPFAPLVQAGNPGTAVCITDDAFSAPIIMPANFKFNFYGNCYSIFQISTNNYLTFNATNPVCSGGSPWAFTNQIPQLALNNAAFRNSIYFPMQDTNPSVANPSGSPVEINYLVDGIAPCRKLIIDVKNMPLYSCGINQGLQESQLILFEATNIIEVHVNKRTPCTTWNSGSGVIGIQDSTGNLGVAPPGRNTGNWAATNEAWRFTPSGPSLTSFKWLDANGTTIGTNPSISVCPTATTTYTAQVSYTECNLTGSASVRTVTKPVTVEVSADLTQNPISLIQNATETSFNLSSNIAIVLGGLPASEYSIYFYTSQADAQNLTNPIVFPNSYTIVGTNQTIYMSIESINNGCILVKSFNISLNTSNPCTTFVTPTFNQIPPICQNSTPQTLPSVSTNSIIGVWSPSTIATNFAGTTTYTFTPYDGQCATPTTINVVVNPLSFVIVNNPTICQGETAMITATTSIPGTYFYSWTAPSGVANPGNVASFMATNSGQYSVIATNLTTGCSSSSASGTVTIIPCAPISGFHLNAFFDTNNNGLQDSGEINFPFGQFHFQVNNTIHNIFSFSGSYDITESNPNVLYNFGYTINSLLSNYFTVNPATYANMHITSTGGIINVNFAISINLFSDLAIHNIPLSSPVPGFNYQHLLLYANNGLLSASGSINFIKDFAVTMVGVSEPSAVINANGFTYNFTNLQPFQNRSIIATMHVPPIPTVNIGQLLVTSASINLNSGTDMILSNNNSSSYRFVVGSYDPNDISESHGREILHSSFTTEDYLYYTIRFENTGTSNAINVRIDNLLDSQLDESTLEMIGSSHDYVMDRVGNAANWKFNNIQLPPSVADSNIGKGYVMYKIKPKAGYAVGDIIPNSASIFFDTNPAIITNSFLTEFVSQLNNDQFSSISFMVYPNPAKEQLTVQMSVNTKVKQIKLIDMLGRIIKIENYSSTNSIETINLKEVATGGYFVEVITDSNQKEVKKIIVN